MQRDPRRERESLQQFRAMQEVTLQVLKYWLVARNSRFISTESVNQLFSESERENRIKDVRETRTQRNQKMFVRHYGTESKMLVDNTGRNQRCSWGKDATESKVFVRQRCNRIKDVRETLRNRIKTTLVRQRCKRIKDVHETLNLLTATE